MRPSLKVFDHKYCTNLESLTSILNTEGIILIKDIPINESNYFLKDYSRKLGVPSIVSNRYPNIQDGYIHILENTIQPIINKLGKEVISSTSHKFDLHTDEFFSLNMADYVILFCQEKDEKNEGLSTYAHLEDIISDISSNWINLLLGNNFPCRNRLIPILFYENGKLRIRFNSYEILDNLTLVGSDRSILINDIVQGVSKILSKHKKKILLLKGDCLIINNKTTLHGRTGFDFNSSRLFKRIRICSRSNIGLQSV